MKTLKIVIAIAALAVGIAAASKAQEAGLYSTGLNGGTNNILAASTNIYPFTVTNVYNPYFLAPPDPSVIGFGCEDFTNCGCSIYFRPLAGGSGNVTFRFKKSYDRMNNWGAVPTLSMTATLDGTTNWQIACGSMKLDDATDFILYSVENPTSANLTNLTWTVNFKSPKYGAFRVTE